MDPSFKINEADYNQLRNLIKDLSLEVFCDYVGDKFSEAELDKNALVKEVYKDKMSFILLSGTSFNINYRCFFNPNDFKEDVGKNIGLDKEEVTEELVQDFMSEYCNLVAGSLKNILSTSIGEKMGISIPIVTNGFEYLYFGLKRAGTHYLFWRFQSENKDALFCVELEELRGFDFNNFKEIKKQEEDDDDVFNF